jgi:hypothetical protein
MGFQANGERFYFYTGGVLYALFQRYQRASFYAGIAVTGATAQIQAGLQLWGTSTISAHINASPTKSYNLGGSSTAWNYVNARGFSTVSMASFDSPVLMPDGRKVDDIEALKCIKERPDGIKEPNGRPTLDKRTFPVDVQVKAYDSETGKEYPRNKDGDPIVDGKVMPGADGIDLVQFTSLLFGAFKLLVERVEKLEKERGKNVKI